MGGGIPCSRVYRLLSAVASPAPFPCDPTAGSANSSRLFYFYIFQKKLQKYIFGFRFYSFILLLPGRGSRGLYINKNNFFCAEVNEGGRASPVELPPSPILSPSPLSGSRGQKMRARGKGRNFIFGARACRPLPGGRPHAAGTAGGRQAPAKDLCAKKFIFIYI